MGVFVKRQQDKSVEMLCASPLFTGLCEQVVAQMAGRAGAPREYARGERLLPSPHGARELGVLLSGCAQVNKVLDPGGLAPVSILNPGQLFGAATLFHDMLFYATTVVALRPCAALFFSQPLLETLFREDFRLVQNYLAYLSGRIYFLNKKIQSLSGMSPSRKLVSFLLDNATPVSEEEAQLMLPYSIQDLAAALSLSRSTLYRAMNALQRENVIRRTGKHIHIPSLRRLHAALENRKNIAQFESQS